VRELRRAVEHVVLFTDLSRSRIEPREEALGRARVPRVEASFRSAKARVINDFDRGYLEQAL
jgi:hypothetical protein